MDANRRAWLEQLISACEGAQARLADHDERLTVDLRASIDDLHARLTSELNGLDQCR